MSWHVPSDTLTRFATQPEALDDVTASSIEQHLMACGDCRSIVAAASDSLAVEASWSAIADVIDAPSSWPAERALTRLGVPEDLSRVVGATPGLRLAWLAAVVLVGVAAVAAARESGTETAFLVAAPLVPLVAVTLAFLPVADPGGEAAVATALHGPGLALRRTLAVLLPTVVLLAVAGLAVPGMAGWGVAWVLPGLGLASASLAVSTFVRVPVAVCATAVAWFAAVAASGRGALRHAAADVALFQPAGQLGFVALIAVAVLTLVARRGRFATMEVSW